jgi:hypothetical protein
MCCHMNRTGAESPCSKQEKPDTLVLETGPSGFVETGDSQGHRRAAMMCSSSGQTV